MALIDYLDLKEAVCQLFWDCADKKKHPIVNTFAAIYWAKDTGVITEGEFWCLMKGQRYV